MASRVRSQPSAWAVIFCYHGWKNEIKALCGSWMASHPGTGGTGGRGDTGPEGKGKSSDERNIRVEDGEYVAFSMK